MPQNRNAMNPPPLPGPSPAAITMAPSFEEEPDTQDDLPFAVEQAMFGVLQASPTERTPVPPPEETPNASDIRTLRSPPPERGEGEAEDFELAIEAQSACAPGSAVAHWLPALHDQQVRLARKP